MNSVMDDNRLLTLPNGDRIRLQNHCKLLMEVADLQYASPATISRCGMVYVDPKDLGWAPYVWKWVRTNTENIQTPLRDLFDKYCTPCVDFVLEGKVVEEEIKFVKRFDQIIPLTNLNMVNQLCTMLSAALLKPEEEDTKKKVDEVEMAHSTLEALFISSVVWSIGSSITQHERPRFDEFLKNLAGHISQDNRTTGRVPATMIPCKEPTLYEYVFFTESAEWCPFKEIVKEYTPPPDNAFHKIMVPTVDTVRTEWILSTVAGKVQKPVLLVGESGTAKTVCVNSYLASQPSSQLLSVGLNFSSKTSSMDVQRTIEDNIGKRMKGVFGPPTGTQLAVFLDDLNMPKTDLYGTQQPIALLKLLIERGGLYDRGKDLTWFKVVSLQYIAAMGPPGGGRSPVDPRFISMFSTFCIAFPADEALIGIYSKMIMAHVIPFALDVQGVADALTKATMTLYNGIVASLPPTPSKFHYIFNLRDLSRVYEGLLRSTPDMFPNAGSFVRLWRNECLRVFFDRLNNDDDRKFVETQIGTIIREKFGADSTTACADPIIFGDFLQCKYNLEEGAEKPEVVRLYQDVVNYETILPILEGCLAEYNNKVAKMNLVLFDMALEHIARITRVLRMKRGNAMLIGVGGSGKQSNTMLAAYAAECGIFQIKLSRGYGDTEFKEDLKKLYNMVVQKPTVFLFTDGHVAEESFLELVNNILTAGMVPALFPEEEKAL